MWQENYDHDISCTYVHFVHLQHVGLGHEHHLCPGGMTPCAIYSPISGRLDAAELTTVLCDHSCSARTVLVFIYTPLFICCQRVCVVYIYTPVYVGLRRQNHTSIHVRSQPSKCSALLGSSMIAIGILLWLAGRDAVLTCG